MPPLCAAWITDDSILPLTFPVSLRSQCAYKYTDDNGGPSGHLAFRPLPHLDRRQVERLGGGGCRDAADLAAVQMLLNGLAGSLGGGG